jgi:hypothetical protein
MLIISVIIIISGKQVKAEQSQPVNTGSTNAQIEKEKQNSIKRRFLSYYETRPALY